MWLAYGRNDKDELIHVSEVKRGKSALACPYCGGLLTAKKGRVKAHHFAHSEETCQTTSNYDFYDITKEEFPVEMGLYDYAIQRKQEMEADREHLQADIEKTTKDLQRRDEYINEGIQLLEKVSKSYKDGTRPKSRQRNFDVLQQLRKFRAGDKLTEGIKCLTPHRSTILPDFSQVRHGSFKKYLLLNQPKGKEGILFPISRHSLIWPREIWQLESTLSRNPCIIPDDLYWTLTVLPEYRQQKGALTQLQDDLASFEQEQERFQQFTLYFLEIRADHDRYHKIGITGRTVEDRVKEVSQDARKLGKLDIRVKNQVKGYAFLEIFFKHKYADYQLDFGSHAEYFKLPATALEHITGDLNRLEYLSLDRIGKIKAGMQKAKAQGKHVGRPAEQEKVQKFLQKPKSQEILALLKQGLKLREIQRRTGYAINTIRKVNNLTQ